MSKSFMAKTSTHDTLVYRLAQMLVKLNQGEKLEPQSLAEEFGVNLRTIQRDLNERFAYLPLQKTDGRYTLDPSYLGKLNMKDVERFAGLAGVHGLFPSLSADLLGDIFDTHTESALLIRGHQYEDLRGKEPQFKQLEQAILGRHWVSFDYQRTEGSKRYESIAPYKLMNHKGIWYLAAKDGDRIKTFGFTKLSGLVVQIASFPHDPSVARTLASDDGIWFSDDKKTVVLQVAKEIASYFRRRKLIANQVIDQELDDGGLLVSALVGHTNQILPIVRYWMPHIRILSPDGLQEELESGLRAYLN